MTNTACYITINGDKNNRMEFPCFELALGYLRNEMEADGKTYFMNVTNPRRTSHKSKNASSNVQWARIDEASKTAIMVCRSIYMPNYED
jgi:hypothetical protein